MHADTIAPTRGALLYEGKAKRVFAASDPDLVIFEYKDDATAFNGEKHAVFSGKGELNNRLSAVLFTEVAAAGVATHFVRLLSDTRQLCRRVRIVPLEVVVRNRVAGSMARRLGMEEGAPLRHTVVELCYKDDALGDPLIGAHHAAAIGAATWAEISWMERTALTVARILEDLFDRAGIELVDFKLEFGRLEDDSTPMEGRLGPGRLLLADEISPDTCRLWDRTSGERLDKDRFRRDLAPLLDGYRAILRRLESVHGDDRRCADESQGADGSSPGADGTSPRADGSSPGADGTSPGADGSSPGADGSSPGADGSSPGADGSSPRADGVYCEG